MALGLSLVVLAVAGEATAATGKRAVDGRPAAHAYPGKQAGLPGAAPNSAPALYTIATSGSLTAPTGTQTRGTATCPTGRVVYGGGVFVSSGSTAANVNSSFPSSSTTWSADVNNASGAATSFSAYAVCAKRNAAWSIQSATITNSAGVQNRAIATCPSGTRVLGGGGYSSSGATSVNINSTFPLKVGSGTSAIYDWITDMNNGDSLAHSATSYAVCGHANGYKLVVGATTTNGALSQTGASAFCPAPKVPIGGGVLSSSGSTSVNVNTTYPISGGWRAYENNALSSSVSMTPYVVCAGT